MLKRKREKSIRDIEKKNLCKEIAESKNENQAKYRIYRTRDGERRKKKNSGFFISGIYRVPGSWIGKQHLINYNRIHLLSFNARGWYSPRNGRVGVWGLVRRVGLRSWLHLIVQITERTGKESQGALSFVGAVSFLLVKWKNGLTKELGRCGGRRGPGESLGHVAWRLWGQSAWGHLWSSRGWCGHVWVGPATQRTWRVAIVSSLSVTARWSSRRWRSLLRSNSSLTYGPTWNY